MKPHGWARCPVCVDVYWLDQTVPCFVCGTSGLPANEPSPFAGAHRRRPA